MIGEELIRLTVRELHIISPAAMMRWGLSSDETYLVIDVEKRVPNIQVATIEDLRELVPSLRPASITYTCEPHERPAMRGLLEEIRADRRMVEGLH